VHGGEAVSSEGRQPVWGRPSIYPRQARVPAENPLERDRGCGRYVPAFRNAAERRPGTPGATPVASSNACRRGGRCSGRRAQAEGKAWQQSARVGGRWVVGSARWRGRSATVRVPSFPGRRSPPGTTARRFCRPSSKPARSARTPHETEAPRRYLPSVGSRSKPCRRRSSGAGRAGFYLPARQAAAEEGQRSRATGRPGRASQPRASIILHAAHRSTRKETPQARDRDRYEEAPPPEPIATSCHRHQPVTSPFEEEWVGKVRRKIAASQPAPPPHMLPAPSPEGERRKQQAYSVATGMEFDTRCSSSSAVPQPSAAAQHSRMNIEGKHEICHAEQQRC